MQLNNITSWKCFWEKKKKKKIPTFSHMISIQQVQQRNMGSGNQPTSIEPEGEGLLVSFFVCLDKIVKQASPSLDIHINIPSILPEPDRRLSRQPHDQILDRVTLHTNTQQPHNQNPNKPTPTHLRKSQDPHRKPTPFIHSPQNVMVPL